MADPLEGKRKVYKYQIFLLEEVLGYRTVEFQAEFYSHFHVLWGERVRKLAVLTISPAMAMGSFSCPKTF